MDWKGRRQSENVETPIPGTLPSPPEYAKMAASTRDNASAGDVLGGKAIDKMGRKAQWNQRSRMGSIYDPPQRTDHVNKSYEPLPTGD